MASLTNDTDGKRRIQFKDTNGSRQTIRLGKMPKKNAESVKKKVEDLISAKITGDAPSDETARWLTTLDRKIANRLAKLGLTRRRQSATLATFVDNYIGKRCDVSQSTTANYRHTRRNLVDHFGTNKPLRSITPGDAVDFRESLLASGLEDSTTRKRCAIASQIFLYALKHKLISENPFDAIPKNVKGSKRRAYVSETDANKVLKQLPTNEWKLLFVLSRWGGLRVGSEPRLLRWCDIDWAEGRFLVHSPKTAHHEGRETRQVPLFPEIAKLLTERSEQAEEGEKLVLPMLEGRTDASLRNTILRAAKAAGVEQWTRLWHSMRSSRQTDLERDFPTHVVCNWIGNSQETAREHYLQVTDIDFQKATHNPTQHTAAQPRIASHFASPKMEKPGKHCNNSAFRAPQGSPGGTRTPDQGIMSSLL